MKPPFTPLDIALGVLVILAYAIIAAVVGSVMGEYVFDVLCETLTFVSFCEIM